MGDGYLGGVRSEAPALRLPKKAPRESGARRKWVGSLNTSGEYFMSSRINRVIARLNRLDMATFSLHYRLLPSLSFAEIILSRISSLVLLSSLERALIVSLSCL